MPQILTYWFYFFVGEKTKFHKHWGKLKQGKQTEKLKCYWFISLRYMHWMFYQTSSNLLNKVLLVVLRYLPAELRHLKRKKHLLTYSLLISKFNKLILKQSRLLWSVIKSKENHRPLIKWKKLKEFKSLIKKNVKTITKSK